jgi:hypothetical protein
MESGEMDSIFLLHLRLSEVVDVEVLEAAWALLCDGVL